MTNLDNSTPQELADKLYWYKTTVGRDVDGDTVGDLVFDQGFGGDQHAISCRMFGIDCPEISKPKSAYEAYYGHLAAKLVTDWLAANPQVIVHSDRPAKADDFGRWLVTLYSATTGENLSGLLVSKDLAVLDPDGTVHWRDSHPVPANWTPPTSQGA